MPLSHGGERLDDVSSPWIGCLSDAWDGDGKKEGPSLKSAYFHCVGGASGDMILGAIVDAGVHVERLQQEVEKLHIGGILSVGGAWAEG